MNYQDWLTQNGFTMQYECVGKLPDESTFQVKKQINVSSDKEADALITEWNRLATLTKIVTYSYRRLS